MKVTRAQADRNREAVVDKASQLFRARGVDGVGIGEVMRQCSLTHGGFYHRFGSKEDLAAEACARALAGSLARWHGIVEDVGQDGALAAIADDYLSADAARRGGPLAEAFRAGMEGLAGILEGATGDRAQALALLSQMVGALARGVNDAALSDDILAAARHAIQAVPVS